jgi:DNA-binding GntR family transcriptional regulator
LRGKDLSNSEPNESQESRVYGQLAEMIVSLKLEPGSLVSESWLINELQTSRPVLRDALQELRETGLVSILPRAGIAIAPVGLVDVQNIFEVRLALETYAARLAAQKANRDDVARLRRIAAEIEAVPVAADGAEEGRTPSEVIAMDRKIHMEIARLARNPILERAVERILLPNSRLWHLFFARNSNEPVSFHVSHVELVEAIDNGDSEAAQAAVSHHIEGSLQQLRRVFSFTLASSEERPRARRG